ncbi:MAG: hypothetical protein M1812_000458 [Candelaria pacifica]|nr:MAG: hypothetical protein M1812_000458 [Candelaria pacifica]
MSVSSSTFTCADFNKLLSSFGDAKDEDIPILRPNPDISGLGVLIGFLATAYLTLLAVVVYYFMGFVPKSFINAVDRGILWHKASPEIARLLEPTLRRGVLMFSDQQVVTGIAILASGYAQLRYNISVYHWQIVVYLAWFSSLTHLTTLTMMRQYFRENPTPRLWRATLMLVTVILLTVALIPTGDGWWLTLDGLEGLPAICFFKRLVIRDPQERFQALPLPTAYMIISVMILFISCSTRMIKLSARATDCIRCWTRTKLGNIIKRALRASIKRAALPNVQLRWKLERVGLETLYVLLRAWTDVFESMLWEVSTR